MYRNESLSNALKFTTKGSIRVIIERYDNSDKIIVKINDTGIGIHPEMLPKLFTKFATKSDTGGTGLGLFISKSVSNVQWTDDHNWKFSHTYFGPTGLSYRLEKKPELY